MTGCLGDDRKCHPRPGKAQKERGCGWTTGKCCVVGSALPRGSRRDTSWEAQDFRKCHACAPWELSKPRMLKRCEDSPRGVPCGKEL